MPFQPLPWPFAHSTGRVGISSRKIHAEFHPKHHADFQRMRENYYHLRMTSRHYLDYLLLNRGAELSLWILVESFQRRQDGLTSPSSKMSWCPNSMGHSLQERWWFVG